MLYLLQPMYGLRGFSPAGGNAAGAATGAAGATAGSVAGGAGTADAGVAVKPSGTRAATARPAMTPRIAVLRRDLDMSGTPLSWV